MAKENKKSEFRKTNVKDGKGHPAYIYVKAGKKYRYIGITHSEITDGMRNIPLEQNPEPGQKEKAFILSKSKEAHVSNFGKKLDWFFSKSDKEKVRKVIEKEKNGDTKRRKK